eukprot:scaffold26676_cov137-Cylindrotheca_fusiformis.AAC.1
MERRVDVHNKQRVPNDNGVSTTVSLPKHVQCRRKGARSSHQRRGYCYPCVMTSSSTPTEDGQRSHPENLR